MYVPEIYKTKKKYTFAHRHLHKKMDNEAIEKIWFTKYDREDTFSKAKNVGNISNGTLVTSEKYL